MEKHSLSSRIELDRSKWWQDESEYRHKATDQVISYIVKRNVNDNHRMIMMIVSGFG